MTGSPILRSAALARALSLTPVKGPSTSGRSFATALAQTQAKSTSSVTRAIPVDQISPIPYKDQIATAAKKYGVEPALLAALVKTESNFNPLAQSGVGARGLTQLM